jgi:hypothetical protein
MILDHFKKIFQGLVKTIALTVVWSAGDNQDEDAGETRMLVTIKTRMLFTAKTRMLLTAKTRILVTTKTRMMIKIIQFGLLMSSLSKKLSGNLVDCCVAWLHGCVILALQ